MQFALRRGTAAGAALPQGPSLRLTGMAASPNWPRTPTPQDCVKAEGTALMTPLTARLPRLSLILNT